MYRFFASSRTGCTVRSLHVHLRDAPAAHSHLAMTDKYFADLQRPPDPFYSILRGLFDRAGVTWAILRGVVPVCVADTHFDHLYEQVRAQMKRVMTRLTQTFASLILPSDTAGLLAACGDDGEEKHIFPTLVKGYIAPSRGTFQRRRPRAVLASCRMDVKVDTLMHDGGNDGASDLVDMPAEDLSSHGIVATVPTRCETPRHRHVVLVKVTCRRHLRPPRAGMETQSHAGSTFLHKAGKYERWVAIHAEQRVQILGNSYRGWKHS